MAKLTLLEIVNDYLALTDGYEVSDIDDTVESQQVARVAQIVYLDLRNDVFDTTLTKDIIQLEALADSTKPNYLRLPDSVIGVEDSKVYYNKTTGVSGSTTLKMSEIKYKTPQDFLEFVGGRSTEATNVTTVSDFSGYQMVIQTKKAPDYYTSFDDEYLVFDSYDSDVDSTLQSSKSGVLASLQGTFTKSSTYEIDFPEWFQSGYRAAVIAAASEALREEPIPSMARKARTAIVKARQKKRIGTNRKNNRKGMGR